MPEVNSVKRRPIHRKYAPKTRSGCVTCKVRRIKCDETKPFCTRCTSTGRRCDGYAASKLDNSKPPSNYAVHTALTVDVCCNSLEKRTFDYFRSNTAPGICGFFRDAIWNRLILQVSHSEPAVRHAVNALGALHEETVLRRKACQAGVSTAARCRTNFPIKQYAKAIKEVQQLLQTTDTPLEVILLCSMAFMHFESISECFLSGLLHLENGIRLVRSQSSSTCKPVDPGVIQAILRTDVQASLYLGMRVPGLPFYEDLSETKLPSSFRDPTHARDVVNTWTCRLLYFVRSEADHYRFREPGNVPLEVLAKAQHLEQMSLDLDRLLRIFMQDLSDRLTIRDQRGVDMLRTRVKIDRIIAATCLYSEASAFDIYLNVFEEILLLCEYAMHNDGFDDWLFSVSLDEGLASPLWFVTSNCRDSRIRHRALALMKKLPSNEGIWYLEAMTQIAQACVQYEEALCEKGSPLCEDIPEWRRVHSSGLGGWDVTSRKTMVVAHFRTRPNGMDGEWCDVQRSIEFWTLRRQEYADDLCPPDVPILTTLFPIDDISKTLEASMKWAMHTEPWMAQLPFQLSKCHQESK